MPDARLLAELAALDPSGGPAVEDHLADSVEQLAEVVGVDLGDYRAGEPHRRPQKLAHVFELDRADVDRHARLEVGVRLGHGALVLELAAALAMVGEVVVLRLFVFGAPGAVLSADRNPTSYVG